MSVSKHMGLWLSLSISLFFVAVIPVPVRAQPGAQLSADSLFHLARISAFEGHDHGKAIQYCRLALVKSPGYVEILNFLGRVYTWDHQLDSARRTLLLALEKDPQNEESLEALTDLEYWNDHPAQALVYCERGLQFHPGSASLLQKRAKILRAGYQATKNQLGIYYDYVYFDKQFNDPWHLLSIDYKRQMKFGPLIGRINYANRFRNSGLQGELDAYPHISRTFYSYLNIGYSHDVGVFPKYRGGFSLYANLPKSFEGEAGVRYLFFSDATWIYTGSLGKYYKNFWFNLRTYLTPGNASISQSYTFTTRYYYGDADDYYSLGIGTGISPDDRNNNVQLNDVYRLRSNKIMGGYYHSIKKSNVLFINLTVINQEYLPKTHGNQVDAGIGYQKRF